MTVLRDLSKGYDGSIKQNKRKLSDRSHLTIEFPQSDNRVIRTFVPFLENPTVSEKGKANLNNYNLVGRAGQLFSYGGADSRKLSVNFNITLLHVMEEEKDLNEMFKSQFKLFFSESERAKKAFELSNTTDKMLDFGDVDDFLGDDGKPSLAKVEQARAIDQERAGDYVKGEGGYNETGTQRNHASIHRNYYRSLLQNMAGFDPSEADYTDNIIDQAGFNLAESLGVSSTSQNVNALNSTINLVYLWVNLIRASILNRSDNTTFGPPIIRLTHGGMYNNVPCLLQDYSINIVEEAGYDVQTMTPKRLEISLNLIESRTGNFGRFQAGQIEKGDNLTGWESVIETNNIDPYNGLIGGEGEFGVQV
jgi:hypothetical protein